MVAGPHPRLPLPVGLAPPGRGLPEALTLLDQALATGRPETKGRLLIKKAMVYAKQDKLSRAGSPQASDEPSRESTS
jgi:hypothetical protein